MVLLKGSNITLHCKENSFLRQCTVYMDGTQNVVWLDENAEVYGENIQTVYISGDDNRIILGKGASIRKTSFLLKEITIRLFWKTEFHVLELNFI